MSQMSFWQSMAVQAEKGNLYLSADVAKQCSESCTAYIKKLVLHQDKAEDLASIDGWGSFSSGQQLRELYARKAVGGENSMYDVLQSHIDVVTEMQAVFRKFFVDTTDADQGTSVDIASSGPR